MAKDLAASSRKAWAVRGCMCVCVGVGLVVGKIEHHHTASFVNRRPRSMGDCCWLPRQVEELGRGRVCRTEQRHQFATSVQLLEQNLLEQNGPPGDTAPGRKLQCSKRLVRAIGACVGLEEEKKWEKVGKSFQILLPSMSCFRSKLIYVVCSSAGWLLLVLLQWKL